MIKSRKYVGALLFAMTLWIFPVHAEDKAAAEVKTEAPSEEAAPPAGRFAPDFCDFEITFPEAAYVRPKCLPDGKCYDVNSYTMVYDLRTTVDVSVTCNPSTPEQYGRYNQAVMKAALEGMVSERRLNDYEVAFRDDKTTKGASLSGTGMTGAQEKIYSAQLWIGPNSVMTVQAELIGAEHTEADKVFSDILASIKEKEGKQLPKVAKPKARTN